MCALCVLQLILSQVLHKRQHITCCCLDVAVQALTSPAGKELICTYFTYTCGLSCRWAVPVLYMCCTKTYTVYHKITVVFYCKAEQNGLQIVRSGFESQPCRHDFSCNRKYLVQFHCPLDPGILVQEWVHCIMFPLDLGCYL